MNRIARPRGYVTALAITMIALVAVAIAGLTARLNTSARQAARERTRAQVEELILAGIQAAKQDPAAREIALPETLREAGASLKLTQRDGRTEIEVIVGRTRVLQEIQFAADGARLLEPRAERR